MSSHHVIRDEQEPPIIILSENFDIDLVNDLLGWSPLLIVKEELLYLFQARNIKVDAVIYPKKAFDRNDVITRQFVLNDMHQLSIQKILTLLNNKKFTGVNVFCSDESRDYLLTELPKSIDQLNFPIDLFVGKERTIICPKQPYKKWYTAGQLFDLDKQNIQVNPALMRVEGNYVSNIDAFYEFKSLTGLVVLTEIQP